MKRAHHHFLPPKKRFKLDFEKRLSRRDHPTTTFSLSPEYTTNRIIDNKRNPDLSDVDRSTTEGTTNFIFINEQDGTERNLTEGNTAENKLDDEILADDNTVNCNVLKVNFDEARAEEVNFIGCEPIIDLEKLTYIPERESNFDPARGSQ